eukprot:TRINITY_DN20465_c0_g1_i1.p1 TRINITY_DN20465_c0_g1~~TRINITY_DN20465_c0_g1_i1.p1  ORF type:complete len:841 (-),score=75.36 TRINITY_DN20465_c0_g1_i1:100-2622(-)
MIARCGFFVFVARGFTSFFLARWSIVGGLEFPEVHVEKNKLFQEWHGHNVISRENIDDASGHSFFDLQWCFRGEVFISTVQWEAVGHGNCFQLLLLKEVSPNTFKIESLPRVFSASSPGIHNESTWPHPDNDANVCVGWRLLSVEEGGGHCRVPFSQRGDIGSGSLVTVGRPHAVIDTISPADLQPLPDRAYSLRILVFRIHKHNWWFLKEVMDNPMWDKLHESVQKHQDWGHVAVESAADEIHEKLQESGPGFADMVAQIFGKFFLLWLDSPGLTDSEARFVDRFNGLVAMYFARTMAVCRRHAVQVGPNRFWKFESEEAMTVVTSRFNEMKAASTHWHSPFAVTEHSRWELGFNDVDLFHTVIGGLAEPFCPVGLSPSKAILRLIRDKGMLKQPRVESWWPAPASCSLFATFAMRPIVSNRELCIVVVETHHADFQEITSLLQHVAREHWQVSVDIVSYLLNLNGGDFSLSWGKDGPPATRNPEYFSILEVTDSLEDASAWIQRWLDQDEQLRKADAVVDCAPVWVCVVLHHLAPSLPIVVRINMSLLQHFFAWRDLMTFWSWLRDFMESPVTAFTTKNRLIAEQIYAQTGARPEYVPMLMLHTRPASYTTESSQSRAALVFKCSHPAHVHFRKILRMAGASKEKESANPIRLDFHKDVLEEHGPLTYAQMAAYRMVVLVPHVPNSCSFGDVYAMSIPILIPAEPYIYTWMWAYSNPYAGPGGDPRKRSVAPPEFWPRPPSRWKPDPHKHPEDVFSHLSVKIPEDSVIPRAYWYQFSDYALLPGLQHFDSVVHLLEILYRLSEGELQELSTKMRKEHERRVNEVTRWMSCTLGSLMRR